MYSLDFLARRAHYIDHLAPIYNALPEERRGKFHITSDLIGYAQKEMPGVKLALFDGNSPSGSNPILVCSYGDIGRAARNPGRKIIHMEHGTGHTFGGAAYPDGRGKRDFVSLFLSPNEYTANKTRAVRDTPCHVIGTPKLDEWGSEFTKSGKRADLMDKIEDAGIILKTPLRNATLCISFHWGDANSDPPESGTAWSHYKDILPQLKDAYHTIGHGHPLSAEVYKREFEDMGIEWVADFRDVMRRADVYINDLSSTLYEFLVTGKPVILLNAPWFRADVDFGIRFWDYSDVGLNVWQPSGLFQAIDYTLENYTTVCQKARAQAVKDLYPYLGRSARRAVEVIEGYLRGLEL